MSHATTYNNRSFALSLLALVAGMVMLSFAAVPLYRIFCQVTGFGGTTMQAEYFPESIGTRELTIDFNTDLDRSLDWQFHALDRRLTTRPGEMQLALFEVENLSNQPQRGTAVFNVTPHKAGAYFMKVECFCYDEMTIPVDKRVSLPVSFFIDPEIENDPDLADVRNITLSYTFFKSKQPNNSD